MAHTQARNLVFVGKIQSGKTMFIQALDTYFKHKTLKLCHQNESKEALSPIAKDTTRSSIYSTTIEGIVYNLLDTPGFAEAYGKAKNFEIFKDIQSHILQLPEVHGICFVIKASEKELSPFFEKLMNNLLSVFPKKAVTNIFFIFTHANDCNFTPGAVTTSLKKFIKNFHATNNVQIQYSVKNICIVDNKSYRWLIAQKNDLQCPKLGEEELNSCWDESRLQIVKLINNVSELPGITRRDLMEAKYLVDIGRLLNDEVLRDADAKQLQKLLLSNIFELTMIRNTSNPSGPETTLSTDNLIKGLQLLKKKVTSPELQQKIEEYTRLEADPILHYQNVQKDLEALEVSAPPPVPQLPIQLPIMVPLEAVVKPPVIPVESESEDEELTPRQPPKVNVDLLEQIAEGLADNCEQGDLTSIYEAELSCVRKAYEFPDTLNEYAKLQELAQALRVFEHNPRIGHVTKRNIRTFLDSIAI